MRGINNIRIVDHHIMLSHNIQSIGIYHAVNWRTVIGQVFQVVGYFIQQGYAPLLSTQFRADSNGIGLFQ